MSVGMRCLGALTLLWALHTTAWAQSGPLLRAKASLGSPPRARDLELTHSPDQQGLVLNVGGKHLRLPWPNVTHAVHEVLTFKGGGAVLRVRANGPASEYEALVGGRQGKQLLWQARIDLQGDPGERRGHAIQVSGPREAAVVRVGTRLEAARHCDGRPVLLKPRELDPARLQFRPARAVPDEDAAGLQGEPLEALHPPSALGSLRVLAVSDGNPEHGVHPAAALTDGDPTTAWQVQGSPGPLLVRATHSAAGYPITQIELEAPPAPARLPPTLWLELDDAPPVQLTLDPSTRRHVVALPNPTPAACVALQVPGPLHRGKSWGLAELRTVTVLDESDPATTLAEALVRGDDAAAEAPRLLARLGVRGARATLDAWPKLDTLGRRRALRVLGRWLGEPQVLAVVADAASDEATASDAIAVLAESDESGQQELTKLAEHDDEPGRLALQALSAAPGRAEPLLDLLDRAEGPQRTALRAALRTQAKVDPEGTAAAASTWLPEASPAGRAALALATAGTGPHLTSVAQRACEPGAMATAEFVERYRCAAALAELSAEPNADAWLESQARDAEEWMQRSAALDALVRRHSPLATRVAREALDDAYPRVRVRAADALTGGAGGDRLKLRAARDRWPMVRAAAVRALRGQRDALPLLRERVQDGSRDVRTAAIDALTELHDADAWPAVKERLEHPREVAKVRAAGVHFAAALCLREAAPSLLLQLERSITETATQPDAAVAIDALRTLRTLGGDARARAEAWIAESGAPEALGRSAGEPGPCRPSGATL